MANYASDAMLNKAADALTAQGLSVRLHSGAPGNAGTANRIGTISADVAAAAWSAAGAGALDAGVAEVEDDLVMGVLSTSAATTPRAYSVWEGSTFLYWADFTGNAAARRIAANERCVIAGGSIEVRVTRP